MGEQIRRIPRVQTNSLKYQSASWLSATVLILDIAFLLWGIARLILIAFPRLQIAIVGAIFQLLALTREGELDRIFEALQRFFVLPEINRFNILGDVLINMFVTALLFTIGFGIYKAFELLGKHLVKQQNKIERS